MQHKSLIVPLLVLILILISQTAGAQQALFEPYMNVPVGDGQAVGIGDFNSDGLNDVAMTTGTKLLVFLQNREGNLETPVLYTPGYRSESLAVGDLNNDGKSDIVTANFSGDNISVFLQQEDGTLAPSVFYPTSAGPDAVAIGDLNSDGLNDIAVAHWNSGNIGIFIQTSSGTLIEMVSYPSPQAGYDDIAIGDINGDGRNDVVKMNGQGWSPSLSIYLQHYTGTLLPAVPFVVPDCSYSCRNRGVETGDVTGDGRTDIVLSYGGNRPDANIAVFAQGPIGILQAPVSYSAYDLPEPVEIADVNSDGLMDVLTVHGGWNAVGVFLQQNGTLSPYSLYTIPDATRYKAQGFDIGDINNDALPDLAIADYNHGLVVLYHTPPFVDDIPPVLSVAATTEDGTAYPGDTWTNQTVSVSFTCHDNESGIASCPPDQVFEAEGVIPLTTVTATDNSGNSTSVSFGPIKIDKTPPELSIAVSPSPVLLNGSAELLKSATDELSGVAGGPCFNIDTSTVGLKSVTCGVYDFARNITRATVPYQVIYDFDGFFSPVIDCVNNACEAFDLSIINPGSTIPLKFQLKDANGNIVRPAIAPLWIEPMKFDSPPPTWVPGDYQPQVTSKTFEWKKGQNQYVYDWSTKGLPAPTIWLVAVKLDDGMIYGAFITLIK